MSVNDQLPNIRGVPSSGNDQLVIKFGYSEKATQFEKIFHLTV